MITPFTETGAVDYDAAARLVEWYVAQGVNGIFAVCGSSEMFDLSLTERVELAAHVNRVAAGRVPVIASGHVSPARADQLVELRAMAATGVAAVVLITSLIAAPGADDEVFWANLDGLVSELGRPAEAGDPGSPASPVPLGLYECPRPYKRLLSPQLLRRCAESGRFVFCKDTSCDVAAVTAKAAVLTGGGLRLYNANTATLLPTLRAGVTGYCGVMANFHPDLYGWLIGHPTHERADEVAQLLTMFALIERQRYPTNAKEHLRLEGVLTNTRCRTAAGSELSTAERLEVAQLRTAARRLAASLPA